MQAWRLIAAAVLVWIVAALVALFVTRNRHN